MRCRICGGRMERRITDLPFKVSDTSIVIVKALPAFVCIQCGETELESVVMAKVEQMLSTVDQSAELEVLRYAA
ncbi:MAG: YgiT-type zinc finger protein [Acidobacteriaceae bacterium]